MKLLRITGRYYLFAVIIMYIAGSVAFYLVLQYQLRDDAVEKLDRDKLSIRKNIAPLDSLNNVMVADGAISFYRIKATDTVIEELKDTDLIDTVDNDLNPYLQFQFKAKTRQATYKVVLTKSLIERQDLVAAIAYSFLFLLAIFVLGVLLINWWISTKVWGPFYFILQQLRNFNLDKGNYTEVETEISEFKELNTALGVMADKMKNDYQNLKEFTENASHEIQTPLAGIRAKTELLLQSENLSEYQATQLAAINDSVNRLSRMAQSLLLLSKIENKQFWQTEAVSVHKALLKQLDNLRELIAAKGLKLTEQINANTQIQIHPYLLDILISNLLINAIVHNTDNGYILISLEEHALIIENPGNELQMPVADLFGRFKKGDDAGGSAGIGLSIVRKICDANNLHIEYIYLNKVHRVVLKF